ncbi:MAG: thioredoxin family protein [Candidatus Paceibacterota bacterium]
MNKTTGIIIAVIVLIATAGLVYASMNKDEGMMKNTEDKVMNDDVSQSNKDVGEMDKGIEGDEVMKTGSYEAYSPEKLGRAETGDVVIFFHASWCPSCRSLNTDIENNLDEIPSGVSILKADYDTESELKKKYGVTYQHTLVQVSADGTMIKKWSGSPTLSSLASKIE